MSSNGEERLTEMKKKRKTTPRITTKKKKKNKPSTTPQSSPFLSLPDDLVLNIVARVPRLYYPTLSLVSKSFRSLLASPELYKVRSLLGKTESCLYVCINWFPEGFRWFTLCRKPDQTLTNDEKKKSSGYVLASVPMTNTPHADFASVVALGSDIYNIGVPQSSREASSSSVFILDCRSHTWRQAPSLPVELFTVSVGLIDGKKIYAAGFFDANSEDKNSLSVFDPKTQAWDPVPIPCSEPLGVFYRHSACIDGKLHVAAQNMNVAYNFKEARWDSSQRVIYYHMISNSFCVVENVLYSASHGAFKWYDTEAGWRVLQGLVGLPKFPHDSCVRLGNFGGKLAVLWETIPYGNVHCSLIKKMIWCAVIELERRPNCEIWGKVEWFDHVLTVSIYSTLESVVSATV
ncbi:unnamed protein product [Arabidopsis lyrata]|nr:F-box/kelch-repeat protein At5g51250 [Arabidopsis lyrata subsp. lyrata]CAH8260149.1 unnamed protein product [Arabidopsis lyrata]|eukprot:XP_020888272.1 F-box/kelch-repeat protein At5g51250 [Arabidopsis lyrata subsp. lyrata]